MLHPSDVSFAHIQTRETDVKAHAASGTLIGSLLTYHDSGTAIANDDTKWASYTYDKSLGWYSTDVEDTVTVWINLFGTGDCEYDIPYNYRVGDDSQHIEHMSFTTLKQIDHVDALSATVTKGGLPSQSSLYSPYIGPIYQTAGDTTAKRLW